VRRATFSYAPREGLTAELQLHNVGMNIPIEQEDFSDPHQEPFVGPPARSMRMHGVDGSVVFARERVAANVQGQVEDVPYTVALT
jgi:hypothetical protein